MQQHSAELTNNLSDLLNKVEDYVRHFPNALEIKPPNLEKVDKPYTVSITPTGGRLQKFIGSRGYIVRWNEGNQQKLDVNFPPNGDDPAVNATGLSDLQMQSRVRSLTEIIDLAMTSQAYAPESESESIGR